MSSKFKPPGYNAVSPYFVVQEPKAFRDFLVNVFDIEDLRHYYNPDGSLMHGELRIEDSVIMYAKATDRYHANTHLMHVYVADVDTVFQRALDAGAKAVQPPQQKADDPDKRGMFEDVAGNVWAVGMQV